MSNLEIEILSDSDDTIIISPREPLDNDPEIENIVNKYIAKWDLPTDKETINYLEYKDEDLTDIPLMKKLKSSDTNSTKSASESSSTDASKNDDINTLQLLCQKYKLESNSKNLTNDLSIPDKCEISPKEMKMKERERKKIEKEREKSLKKALMAANKNMKPGECINFICVHLDKEVVNQEYGNEVITTLQAAEVKYEVQSQIFPNTISWTRKIQTHLMDEGGQLALSVENQETDEILLIMNCKDFIGHVSNNSLCSHIQSLKSVLTNKKITLVVFGLQSYFRHQNNQKQNEFKSQIPTDTQREIKNPKTFKDCPPVSKRDIEFALTELQILCNSSHRLINSPSQLGLVVAQFTKSIAELPYKLQKQEKYQQTDWFAAGDNKDCVKVDKDGNGLQRLYKQMLMTFPLASLETAEAIASKYPTITSLMEAYESCKSTQEAESMLKEIPIRRAAGPLSATRKTGPEISKKIFNFFNSVDGNTLL